MVAWGGACMVALGGYAWLLQGGSMHGCSGGGYAWLLWGGGMCGCLGVCMVAPGGVACVVAPRGHMVAPGGRAWDTTRYRDTINERAVRILLECILVVFALRLRNKNI